MRIIYYPAGKAKEYSKLAVSLLRNCHFGCEYCFAPDSTFTDKETFRKDIYPRKNALKLLEKDCQYLSENGIRDEVLMSFTTDPYQPLDEELQITRDAIKIFISRDIHFTILTKAGRKSTRDFDLMEKEKSLCRYGTTLTCNNPETEKKWEPRAAPWYERISALKEASERGIRTWASIEPIIDIKQSLSLISESVEFVDQYRIGKMNYQDPGISTQEFIEFVKEAHYIISSYGKKCLFKKSMDPYIREALRS